MSLLKNKKVRKTIMRDRVPRTELREHHRNQLGGRSRVRLLQTLFAFLLCASSCAAQAGAPKGDGRSDDTAALEAIIAKACSEGGSAVIPAPRVFFKVFRTISTPCWGLHIIGTSAPNFNQLDQFAQPPMADIRMADGVEAPVFTPRPYTTFEDIDIDGFNEAVLLRSVTNISFRNVCLSSTAVTGLPDNTPLKVTNSFWIWFKGGCLMAYNTHTVPIILFTGEESLRGEAPVSGLMVVEDVIAAGGGMKYVLRTNQWGTSGDLTFRNILIEDIGTDVLSFYAENGARYGPMHRITFDHVSTSDGIPVSLLSVNDPSLKITGLFINQSSGGFGVPKVRGRASPFFDTDGVFDSLSGNTIQLGGVKIDSTGITIGDVKLGVSSNGLTEFVPMILPPSNVQVVPGSALDDGKLEGTHYYIVIGLDGNQAIHRSPYAYSPSITMDRPGSAIITWTPSPSNPAGYFVIRGPTFNSFYVQGGGSSSFIDRGDFGGCCFVTPDTPTLIAKPLATQ
jgi:hypothetical protein